MSYNVSISGQLPRPTSLLHDTCLTATMMMWPLTWLDNDTSAINVWWLPLGGHQLGLHVSILSQVVQLCYCSLLFANWRMYGSMTSEDQLERKVKEKSRSVALLLLLAHKLKKLQEASSTIIIITTTFLCRHTTIGS